MPAVKLSPSTATPSTAATAGLTYVITVARTGPISAMRAKKMRKASAVQTTARVTTDATTDADGELPTPANAVIGTYARAVTPSEAQTTPSGGRSASHRCRITGPTA